jgi:hypothetical protein
MAIFPTLIYRFSTFSINIPVAEIDKVILNFIWKYKGLRRSKTILKKSKMVGHTVLCLKLATKGQLSRQCGADWTGEEARW